MTADSYFHGIGKMKSNMYYNYIILLLSAKHNNPPPNYL